MSGATESTTHRPNPIFARFVPAARAEENVGGLLAYGLYKIAKREWAEQIQDRHGREPTAEERAAYIATWTESRLRGLEQQANATIAAFGAVVVSKATPGIREDALRGTAARAISTSMAANALYTVGLILVAVILSVAGIDVVGVVQKFRPPGG